MHYAPHTLQKRTPPAETTDEYGRPVVADGSEEWTDVCRCRCDHSDDKEFRLDDGTVVRPEYRIVTDGNAPGVSVGDIVRCVRADGTVRGEGRVVNTKTLNYLPYAEIYV